MLIVGGLALLALVAILFWGAPPETCPEGNLLTYQMCMANNSEASGERFSAMLLGMGLVLAGVGLAVAVWRRMRRSAPE